MELDILDFQRGSEQNNENHKLTLKYHFCNCTEETTIGFMSQAVKSASLGSTYQENQQEYF